MKAGNAPEGARKTQEITRTAPGETREHKNSTGSLFLNV